LTIIAKITFQASEIQSLHQLEAICKQAEGIELRVGLDALAHRTGDAPFDFVCEQSGEIIGSLHAFTFDGREAELYGMVHPEHRRRGVFRSLLERAEAELRSRGFTRVVYAVPLLSPSGTGWAERTDAVYRNAEYCMLLSTLQHPASRRENLILRPAAADDFEFLVACSSRAFGDPEDVTRNLLRQTDTPNRTSYVALVDGIPVGMIRVMRSSETGCSIHGFSVLPEHQGKGYGRQILADTVQLELDAGRTRIDLDVETENDNALGLYKSCGFEVTSSYGYYVKPL